MVHLKGLNYRRETEGQNLLAHLPENIRNASADNLMEGLTTICSLNLVTSDHATNLPVAKLSESMPCLGILIMRQHPVWISSSSNLGSAAHGAIFRSNKKHA